MKILKTLLTLVLVFTFVSSTSAIAQKFGHINSQELLTQMPETKAAQTSIEKKRDELQAQAETMNNEFQKKIQEYQEMMASQNSSSDLLKQNKEKELQDLQQRIQAFQGAAREDLAKKEAELLSPVIEKAQKAIEEVGKENNLVYIFEVNSGTLLYFSDESLDVLPLVKAKLGL